VRRRRVPPLILFLGLMIITSVLLFGGHVGAAIIGARAYLIGMILLVIALASWLGKSVRNQEQRNAIGRRELIATGLVIYVITVGGALMLVITGSSILVRVTELIVAVGMSVGAWGIVKRRLANEE
jgi:hypothetical protein